MSKHLFLWSLSSFFSRVAVELSLKYIKYISLKYILSINILTYLTMIGLDFWPVSLGFPVRCVRSISPSVIDNSRCSLIVARHKSSVFSFLFSKIIPFNNKQLHLVDFSCLSTWPERLSTYFYLIKQTSNVLIHSFFSFLSFLYSPNLFEINSIAFVSSVNCFSPLIYYFLHILKDLCYLIFYIFNTTK